MRVATAALAQAALALIAFAPHAAAEARRPRPGWCRTAPSTTCRCSAPAGRAASTARRGRIAFDFGGDACDGYTLKYRQVTVLDCERDRVADPRRPHRHLRIGRRQDDPLQDRSRSWRGCRATTSTASADVKDGGLAIRLKRPAPGEPRRAGAAGLPDRAHEAPDRERPGRPDHGRGEALRRLRQRQEGLRHPGPDRPPDRARRGGEPRGAGGEARRARPAAPAGR